MHGFHHWFSRPHRQPPFFPGRPGFERFVREPGPRAERGAVRYLVLDALAAQPRHGYEIMQAIGDKSGGQYKPSPGVIYPTLQMLDELGHVKSVEDGGRRTYTITSDGKADLAAHAEDVDDFYARSGGEEWESHRDDFAELAAHVAKLFKKVRRAAHRGALRPSTMKALRKLLESTLDSVDEILGED